MFDGGQQVTLWRGDETLWGQLKKIIELYNEFCLSVFVDDLPRHLRVGKGGAGLWTFGSRKMTDAWGTWLML